MTPLFHVTRVEYNKAGKLASVHRLSDGTPMTHEQASTFRSKMMNPAACALVATTELCGCALGAGGVACKEHSWRATPRTFEALENGEWRRINALAWRMDASGGMHWTTESHEWWSPTHRSDAVEPLVRKYQGISAGGWREAAPLFFFVDDEGPFTLEQMIEANEQSEIRDWCWAAKPGDVNRDLHACTIRCEAVK